MPRLSVVVPFFGVERYIATCLESLRHQTYRDLEVVLVDDGSTDGSRGVAEAFCDLDARFRLVTQANQGLGPARNTGLDHASGELVAFVDSDDLVQRHGYELMVGRLDETGSDLVAADARRFTTMWVRQSFTHRESMADDLSRTHVRERPSLVDDRMAWNKVYRRSLLDGAGLRFPAMLYEDWPVTLAAHLRAEAVDVLRHPVYYWREREGGDLSITQARASLANIADRVTSGEAVLDLVAAEAPELSGRVERHLFATDLDAVVGAVHEADESEVPAVLDLGRRLLGRISGPVRDAASAERRVQAALLERDDVERLRSLVHHRDRHGTHTPVVRAGRLRPRFERDLPSRTDTGAGVPRSLYAVGPDELELDARVEDAAWRHGRLVLRGWVEVPDVPVPADAAVELALEHTGGTRLELRPTRHLVHLPGTGVQPAGFEVAVNPFDLGDPPRAGQWRMVAGLRTTGLRRTGPVRAVAGSRAAWCPPESIGRGRIAQPQQHGEQGWGVTIRRPAAVVSRVSALADALEVLVRLRDPLTDDDVRLELTRHDAVTVVADGAVEHGSDGVDRYRARVPVDLLHPDDEVVAPVEDLLPWTPRLVVAGRALPVAVDARSGTVAVPGRGSMLRATRTRAGNLVVDDGPRLPLVDAVRETGDVLRVEGYLADPSAQRADLVLRRWFGTGDPVEVRVALEVVAGTFAGDLDLRDLVAPGRPDQARLAVQPWQALVAEDGREGRLLVPREVVGSLPAPRGLARSHVRVSAGRADTFVVHVRPGAG